MLVLYVSVFSNNLSISSGYNLQIKTELKGQRKRRNEYGTGERLKHSIELN